MGVVSFWTERRGGDKGLGSGGKNTDDCPEYLAFRPYLLNINGQYNDSCLKMTFFGLLSLLWGVCVPGPLTESTNSLKQDTLELFKRDRASPGSVW